MKKTQFKKGQSGNPSGRPKGPSEITLFKAMSYKEHVASLQKFGSMTSEQLEFVFQNPYSSQIDKVTAKVWQQAAEGNHLARLAIWDRCFPKPKEERTDLSAVDIQTLLGQAAEAFQVLQAHAIEAETVEPK